jgi:hypothetical protein
MLLLKTTPSIAGKDSLAQPGQKTKFTADYPIELYS